MLVYLLLLAYALFRWGSGREIVLGAAIMLGRLAAVAADRRRARRQPGRRRGRPLRRDRRRRGAALPVAGPQPRARPGQAARTRAAGPRPARHGGAPRLGDGDPGPGRLATAPTDPDAAADALRVIEAEASRALAEMRAMVRVLRTTDGDGPEPAGRRPDPPRPAAPAPGRRSTWRSTTGLDDLPPSVGTAVYRLAQEAVTNARRHARHATRIEVRVAADDTSVRLRVSDDGEARAAARHTGLRAHRHDRTRRPARRHLRGRPEPRSRLDRHRRSAAGRGRGVSERSEVSV